jgi:stage II sporulation protein D
LARRRFLFLLSFAAFACGGKPSRRSLPTAPPSTPGASAPVSAAGAPAPARADLDRLALEPRIRIGLSTSAPFHRLTSSRPFRVGDGSLWLETQDVFVQPEPGAAGGQERWIYRVELASFPSESAAGDFRARAAEELERELVVSRSPAAGRYAVRLGEFGDEAAAANEARALRSIGFDSATVVRDATERPEAIGFLLVGAGSLPLRVPSRRLAAVPSSPDAFVELDGRPYRGYLEIALNRSGSFTAINVVNLEEYLRGVVPAELSPDAFPEKEALKAQAIAARTYAVKRRGQFESDGYDLCATPACQVYRGVSAERPLSNAAVAETAGEVLTFGGEPVDALYTSTCGGRTENAENVFSQKEPYLVSRACLLESRAPLISSSSDAPLSLEGALLRALGVLDPGDESRELSYTEARSWLESALRVLGQTPCWREPAASDGARVLDLPALASLLSEGLCWERRLPFLLSAFDAERIVGGSLPEADRIRLAFAIRSGLLVPNGTGIRPGERLSRGDGIRAVHRLLAQRGEPLLKEGRIRRLDVGSVTIRGDDGDTEVSMALAPSRRLFREIAGASTFARDLTLLPNDRVRYRSGDQGIDVLVLLEDGGSFDRSSRFSHWVVRKSAEDLSREVNASSPVQVGSVRDLRPKRYGASGRIAELEVVGTLGTTTLKGLAIRRALGIRENLFFFDAQHAPDGTVRGWVFTGRGWGHGVGMCQVGAYGMAAEGFSYREILSHYYPGTRIDNHRSRP